MSDNDEEEEQQLYDEFGNYIGPDLDSSDDDEDDEEERRDIPDDHSDVSDEAGTRVRTEGVSLAGVGTTTPTTTTTVAIGEGEGPESTIGIDGIDGIDGDGMNAIVLHEDKVHYPSAQEVYGEEVRTAVIDEDIMDLYTPLVEPIQTKSNRATKDTDEEKNFYYFSDDYMTSLFGNQTTLLRRGVAIVGNLHTAEQSRQMSLVSTPFTTILPDTRGKSYLCTLLDCPGHSQFHDESVAALKIVDGVVLVVDIVEGPNTLHTEMILRQAVQEGLPITLILNKIDRCILELKLPPRDCYFKCLHAIEQINQLLLQQIPGGRNYPPLQPQRGNVLFASAQHQWCFSLQSFATLHLEHLHDAGGLGDNLTTEEFAKRLWGNAFWNPKTKKFYKSEKSCRAATATDTTNPSTFERTFITFVLRPLYKLYAACLGESEKDLNRALRRLGVLLPKETLRASPTTLITQAASKLFKSCSAPGFVDMIKRNIPSPAAAAKGKVARCYTGPSSLSSSSPDPSNPRSILASMLHCDPSGPLMIHVTKLYSAPDGQSPFSAFGRIYSGTIRPGQTVRILGEAYVPNEDEEDTATATVESIAIPRGRHYTTVNRATAGNWILIQGIDATIAKTATITDVKPGQTDIEQEEQAHIFQPLTFPHAGGESVMKLAIEPLKPAELPKMVEGLRRISKAYPMARTRVEESGEHVLFGTGELYMDCMMHDLRHVYSDIEVKVADPVVGFRETVIETSSLKCFAETANKRNKLTFIAEPMDDGLAERLESGKVNIDWDTKKLGRFFQSQYDWDLLSARSVWAFGSSPTRGTNILMDDTLPSEVDKSMLQTCKSSIVQGFQWATREGPLCEEPVRGTKVKILDAVLADKPIHRGGGQIIPTARRTVHSSLLTATPRLMEPIYKLQIQCPGEIIDAIQPILTRRRGHIVQDRPISGSMLYSVKAFLPVLDSFGFETDLRTYTQGQAMVHSVFDHWAVVPGDPLDKTIILHPLEPSPPQFLARELLIKTRRRKGLSEDVSVSKFFDEGMKEQLLQTGTAQNNNMDRHRGEEGFPPVKIDPYK